MNSQVDFGKEFRIPSIAIVSARAPCFLFLLCGYFYARSYVLWLMPRNYHYSIIYWGCHRALDSIQFCLIVLNIWATYATRRALWRIVFVTCAILGAFSVMC